MKIAGPVTQVLLTAALAAGIQVACNGVSPDRSALNGTKWLSTIKDSSGVARGELLLEFTDTTAALSGLGSEKPMKYVLAKDTIIILTENGGQRMLLRGDSIHTADGLFGFRLVK